MTLDKEPSPSAKANISSLISVTNAEAKTHLGEVSPTPTKPSKDEESEDHSNEFINGNQPRKRSKVSRACDNCRRKKIKCNAEYSASLQKVTKTCDSCTKNQEECSFSRVPLKRGPSKGYIRDLEEKLEYAGPRSVIGGSANPSSAQYQLPPPPHGAVVDMAKPNHIILPPINGSNKVQLPMLNQPSSNTSANTTASGPDSGIDSPKIQGPFWKVPYEMPSNHHHDLQDDLSRRSSVSSISSGSTTGLRSNLPNMKPGMSDQSSSISDSDDDYYSASSFKQSRRSSGSLSPRNSISSLSSLNGRLSKVTFQNNSNSPNVGVSSISPMASSPNISQQASGSFSAASPLVGTPTQQTQPGFVPFHSRSNSNPISMPGMSINPPGQLSGPMQVSAPGAPKMPGPNALPHPVYSGYTSTVPSPVTVRPPQLNIAVIDQNLKTYYSKFHQNFPILPFNETFIYNIFEIYFNNSRQDEKFNMVIDLFNQSLHQVINYQFLNLNDSIQLVHKLVSLYPFNNFGIKLENNVYLLFFSSLVLINYAVLLNGTNYSLPLSITLSIFNDYKILESFYDLLNDKQLINTLNFDNLKLYLPKLYYCMVIIDNYFSLSFGINKLSDSNTSGVLMENINYLIPNNSNLVLFKSTNLINELISSRNNYRLKQAPDYKLNLELWQDESLKVNGYQNLFLKMIKSKYELINYLIEISHLFNSANFNSQSNDEKNEILNDYLLKLIRLKKNLTNDILGMVDFFLKVVNKFELIQPILNLVINQIFKLIKLNKVIIDSLVQYVDPDVFSRIARINNDLLNGFNNLTRNLNSNSRILSVQSMNMLKSKLSNYNLNFQLVSNPGNQLMNWKYEFFKFTLVFVEREDIDGWLN